MKYLSFLFVFICLFFVAMHTTTDGPQRHMIDLNSAHAQAAFSVTPGDVIEWTQIPGAHYDVILLDTNPGSALNPPGVIDVGVVNEVAVSTLMTTRAAGTYYIRVRSKNPDGSLPSAYSVAVEFTYAGFDVPTGIQKKVVIFLEFITRTDYA